jgi:hypothetical protein
MTGKLVKLRQDDPIFGTKISKGSLSTRKQVLLSRDIFSPAKKKQVERHGELEDHRDVLKTRSGINQSWASWWSEKAIAFHPQRI